MGHKIGIQKRELVIEVGEGIEITFYYRPPTFREAKKHDEKMYKLGGRGGVRDRRTETQLKTGMMLLKGVKLGDIDYPDPNKPGEFLVLDTESMSPPQWKKILLDNEPDMMLQVCQMISSAGVKEVLPDDNYDDELDTNSILGIKEGDEDGVETSEKKDDSGVGDPSKDFTGNSVTASEAT